MNLTHHHSPPASARAASRIPGLVAVMLLLLPATQGLSEPNLYVYPNAGQSEEQVKEDRYACHRWAVKESSFDPADFNQPAQPALVTVPVPENVKEGATEKGIITGAVVGSAIGAIDDHAGEGAVIGGVLGAIVGSEQERQGEAEALARAEARARAIAETDSELALQKSNYRRAISACLEGRNYTVR